MSRGLEREEEKNGSEMETSLSRSGGQEKRQRAIPDSEEGADFGDNKRERVLFRNREYWVRPSQGDAMFAVGRFRAVDAEDLKVGVYRGDGNLATSDIRSLTEQRLAKSLWIRGEDGKPRQILSLTEEGAAMLRNRDPRIDGDNQAIYAGHVKIAELEHDSLLYRAFLAESGRLRKEGGSIRRVLLDYELKKALFSRQQRQPVVKPYRELQQQSAKELSLPVIDGHVTLPDFRIEYENEQGEPARVDVEVATGNYRQAHLAAKVQAGFRVYGSGLRVQEGGRLKANVFRDRPMTVFSL